MTALGLVEDLNKGLIDRFRSLPMARAALLALQHPHRPLWLDVAARTAQEAADALGVTRQAVHKKFAKRVDPALLHPTRQEKP